MLNPIDRSEIKKAARYMTSVGGLAKDKTQDTSQTPSTPSQLAMEYVLKPYREHILLADIAEYANVTTGYISKALHRETGKTFPELLNDVRIAEAKPLLHNCTFKIRDFALQTGFEDPAHFARVFRRATVMTANKYRISTIFESSEAEGYGVTGCASDQHNKRNVHDIKRRPKTAS